MFIQKVSNKFGFSAAKVLFRATSNVNLLGAWPIKVLLLICSKKEEKTEIFSAARDPNDDLVGPKTADSDVLALISLRSAHILMQGCNFDHARYFRPRCTANKFDMNSLQTYEGRKQERHGVTKTKTNTKTKTKAKTCQMIRLGLSVAIRVLRIAGWCLVSDKHTLIWTRLGVFQTSDHLQVI